MSDSENNNSINSSFDSTESSEIISDEDIDGKDSYLFDISGPGDSVKMEIIDGKKIKLISKPSVGEKDDRISPFRMTEYEYVNLIGKRANQIGNGTPVHPKYKGKSTDLLEIARMELNDRSIPFPLKIKRPIGNPINPMRYEIFDPREPDFMMPHELLTYRIEKYIPSTNYKVY